MENLAELFDRDLERLKEEVSETPEEFLWRAKPGISNSCGILAQHIVGNLNHFIGAALGETSYERDRDTEFSNTGLSSIELISQLEETQSMIQKVLPRISQEELEQDYPLNLPWDYSVHEFLLHLYGHLNYHRGQINYLRRIFSEN